MTTRYRILVNGRVQRVSFRANTRQQAVKLGLTGSATNLSDGRVEVIAQGPEEAIKTLLRWLHRGPLLARVDGVRWVEEPVDPSQPDDFREY